MKFLKPYVLRMHFTNKNRGLISGTSRIFGGESEIARFGSDTSNAGLFEPREKLCGLISSGRFYNAFSSSKSCGEVCTFSSQAGAESSGEEDNDLEAGFSELETPDGVAQEAASGDENEPDLISASESDQEDFPDDMQNEFDVIGTETDGGDEKSRKTTGTKAMIKAILVAPALPVSTVLDKWVEEGNEVTPTDITYTMLRLRNRRLFMKALQLSEWAESTKRVEFVESNYASRVDLIAKVRGFFKAEEYLKQIPESFTGELVYRSLLANLVSATNVKKSEELFNKMKSLGFPVTCFSCNQLLLLYKKTDKKKIADVLLLMEKENIKPSLFTYQVLIDVKGQYNDINGMEQIAETMKVEGLKPSPRIQASLARSYANAGLKEKAEAVLKEMEGDDFTKHRWVYQLMLPIYASLEKEDEVDRIWKACESDAWTEECMAAIDAWGRLNKIENAEAAFEKLLKKVRKPSSKNYAALLKVYANHKMLVKGKDLVRQMAERGCDVGPLIWDSLVKLYVRAGEVEKADKILQKAVKQQRKRPFYLSYLTVMDKYAARGDIHNAEKIFQMMRQAGYNSQLRQYQSLLQAYINAKAPAYGFNDRMKADNVFPNKTLAIQLAQANAFRKFAGPKSDVAELLE